MNPSQDSTTEGGAGAEVHPVIPSSCHPVIALVGNPNTGKTTLFNALAGMRQRTGNYPGVTVETKKGHFTWAGESFDLIDLPGTYSLAPRSPDEMVAVDVILGQQPGEPRPDVVLSIVDASNLERNLYLTTQALELGVPVVIALNMIDVAEGHGLRLDAERLSRQMGVPVVPIQANKGKGLDDLKKALAGATRRAVADNGVLAVKTVNFPEPFEREVQSLRDSFPSEVPTYLVRRLLLDVGGYTEQRLARLDGDGLADRVREARVRLQSAGCPVPAVEARTRYGWIREVMSGCVERPAQRPVTWTDRLDRVLTHRIWGTLIFLGLMFLVFQSIFTFAGPLMDLISGTFDALGEWVEGLLGPGMLTSLLADGIIAGVGGILVFLPQILILFLFIAVLEDCGYMARAAFLMDRLMSKAGLSGKSFIPLLSSMACAIPGIMAARVIENRRDRLATILVAPLMSCSARLPVYVLLIGAFFSAGYAPWVPGVVLFSMYLLGLVLAPLVAYALKRTLLRGETPVFVLEMPSYKRPSAKLVARRMLESGWAFIRRAGTIILASMILIWALLYFPNREPGPDGESYLEKIAKIEERSSQEREELEAKKLPDDKRAEALKAIEKQARRDVNNVKEQWTRNSLLGRAGRWMEPAFRPLGWDWRVGVAALASFPAREVVVGTLGIIYKVGDTDPGEIEEAGTAGVADTDLARALQGATWDDDPTRRVFTPASALSLMVFFALCCQCASTLAVIKRETRSWRWPLFTFAYMTALAYVAALLTFQIGKLFT